MDFPQRIEAILEARNVDDAWEVYAAQLSRLGFPHLIYGSHRLIGDRSDRVVVDGIVLSTLPDSLQAELRRRQLQNSLPMLRWMLASHGMKSWRWMHQRRDAELLDPSEAACLDLFAQNKLGTGIAFSLSDRVPQICAGLLLLGPQGTTRTQLDRNWRIAEREITLLSTVLHQRLSNLPYHKPEQILTLRQRAVLELAGTGMTTLEIARHLALTPGTVEKHLRLARKALDARTTAQAVLLAMSRRQIFIETHGPGGPTPVLATTPDQPPRLSEPWAYPNLTEAPQQSRRPTP